MKLNLNQFKFHDPINGAQFIPREFEMKGSPISAKIKPQNSFRKFKTRISKFDHVEGDPNYKCKTYTEKKPYNDCIEKELMTKFHSLLGCHPPLISQNRHKICDKTFNLTLQEESVIQIGNLIENMVNAFDSSSCTKPCTEYNFETKMLYAQTMDQKENMIKIVFDQTVELTKTSFLMGIPSLLTGIGGAISFGRTLLWIIVLIIGALKIVQKIKLNAQKT